MLDVGKAIYFPPRTSTVVASTLGYFEPLPDIGTFPKVKGPCNTLSSFRSAFENPDPVTNCGCSSATLRGLTNPVVGPIFFTQRCSGAP